MEQPPYTVTDFHNALRKRMASSVAVALGDHKLPADDFDAIIEAARLLCRDDLELNGRLALHGLDQDDDALTASEEAYLSVAARGRDDEREWLSLTYWLSDLALADRDPDRVRAVVAALEKSLVKVKAWLADQAPPAAPDRDPDTPDLFAAIAEDAPAEAAPSLKKRR